MVFVVLFIIGICFGSFLNVLIDRIPAGKSVIVGRSQCDYCQRTLTSYDLVPVLSFLFLRGKCRYCHKKLSFQYPLMEILTGLLFIVVYIIESPVSFQSFYFLFTDLLIVSFSLALIVMDIKYRILSDALLLVLLFFSFFRIFIQDAHLLLSHIGIAFLSTIPLLLLYLFSKGKGMGFGDVKLIGILGFLVGFPNIVITYYIAFLTGAVSGVILILGRKKKLKGATIAFGPFLFLGATVAAVWGNTLWSFTRNFIGF